MTVEASALYNLVSEVMVTFAVEKLYLHHSALCCNATAVLLAVKYGYKDLQSMIAT